MKGARFPILCSASVGRHCSTLHGTVGFLFFSTQSHRIREEILAPWGSTPQLIVVAVAGLSRGVNQVSIISVGSCTVTVSLTAQCKLGSRNSLRGFTLASCLLQKVHMLTFLTCPAYAEQWSLSGTACAYHLVDHLNNLYI